MKTRIAAGAEIELLTQEELRQEINPLKAAIEKTNKKPLLRLFAEAGDVAADGTLTLVVNGPPVGFAWDIRRVAIMGPSEAAVAGSCFLYRTEVSPLRLLDFTNSIPDVGPWSARQLSIFGRESLVLHFTGVVAGTRMFVNGQAWQDVSLGHDSLSPDID